MILAVEKVVLRFKRSAGSFSPALRSANVKTAKTSHTPRAL